jgi:CheY-like chemotaxis protein
MDGLAAARAIRVREASGARRVPIVAMTANVLAEARGACFDAGMDDFLPKPFLREDLVRVLARWLVTRTPDASIASVSTQAGSPNLSVQPGFQQVSMQSASQHVGAPAELLHLSTRSESLHLSVPSASLAPIGTPMLDAGRMAAVREASARDREALHRYAHTLQGSAANLGAVRLSALARTLESTAREAQQRELAIAVDQIEQALDAVEIPLRTAVEAGSREVALL